MASIPLFVSYLSNSAVDQLDNSGAVSPFANLSGNYHNEQMTTDNFGNIYVADYSNETIQKITPGGVASTFATGVIAPVGLAFDYASGILYQADSSAVSSTINKISATGVVTPWVTVNISGSGANLYGMTFGPGGDLYVADDFYNQIYRITPGGVASVFATGTSGFIGLTFDGSNFYATDENGNIDQITTGGV